MKFLRQSPKHFYQGRQQKGMVLILVLLIFAFASVLAAELGYQSHREVRRTANILHANEAYLYALGGEAFAIQKLLADYLTDQQTGMKADYLSEAWAVESQPYRLDGAEQSDGNQQVASDFLNRQTDAHQGIGEIFIIIEDLQARFNVNNVLMHTQRQRQDLQHAEAFFTAIMASGIQTGLIIDENSLEQNYEGAMAYQQMLVELEATPNDLVLALLDWVDENQDSALASGAEDDYYQGRTPPYRAANQPIVHESELMAIKGFNEADFFVYNLLLPKRHEKIDELQSANSELGFEQDFGEGESTAPPASHSYFDQMTGQLVELTSAEAYWGGIQHHIAALPVGSKINVNTASITVLQALFSQEEANTIVSSRRGSPYQTVSDIFLNLAQIKPEDRGKFVPYLSVNSEYFLATSIATLGETKFILQSKLHRDENGKIRVIARHFSH